MKMLLTGYLYGISSERKFEEDDFEKTRIKNHTDPDYDYIHQNRQKRPGYITETTVDTDCFICREGEYLNFQKFIYKNQLRIIIGYIAFQRNGANNALISQYAQLIWELCESIQVHVIQQKEIQYLMIKSRESWSLSTGLSQSLYFFYPASFLELNETVK